MSDELHMTPIKKEPKTFLFIWLLPLIAIIIASWMVYKHYSQMSEEINIIFKDVDGLVIDKTPLKYKGIEAGVISNIKVDDNNINQFIVTIELSKKAKNIIGREGTKFWKVEPRVTWSQVSGLNTIVSGSYIEVNLTMSNVEDILKTPKKDNFLAQEYQPIDLIEGRSASYTLKSEKGNISIGSPILYKNFVVGEVIQKKLVNRDVFYTIIIKNEYKNLVKEDSNFWNISGIDIKASLSKININTSSLKSLVIGGIAFSSNKDSKALKQNEKVFVLYNSKDDVGYSEKVINLDSKEAFQLEKEFSKIYYNGIEVGKVSDIKFLPETKRSQVNIKFKDEFTYLLNYNPYFQIIKPEISIDKVRGLSSLIKSNYIELTIHSKKIKKSNETYTLNEEPKKINMYTLNLYTSSDTKISKGSPVYYRNIKVGYVGYKSLDKKRDKLKVNLRIYWIHRHLINDSTLFYEESPIEFEASLEKVYLKTAPIKSFINSSVAFETFDLNKKHNKKSHTLYSNYSTMKKAKYFLQKGKYFYLKTPDVSLLKENEIIYYKGMEVGRVLKSIYNKSSNSMQNKIYILEDFTHLLNESTRFYSIGGVDVDLSLDKLSIKTKSVNSLINGGISFFSTKKDAKTIKEDHIFNFYKSLTNAKNDFVSAKIKMARGFNLKEGSKVLYKDLVIGEVDSLEFSFNDTVQAMVNIKKEHENLLNKDTIFYLDDFKFSINKIQNPSGIILGSNIKVVAGKSKVKQKSFNLVTYKPFEKFDKDGLRVIVNARLKSSLEENSPIYYRQLQIGAVEKFVLSEDSTSVKLHLFIENKYRHLVRKNSIFYNAGAFGVDLYLFGAKIKTETLQTLINGGISLVTPTNYTEQAKELEEFKLEEDLDEDWLDWNPKLKRE